MTVSEVKTRPNPPPASGPSKGAPAKPLPQGLAEVPDRLEPRRSQPQEPPSVFKEFFFKPLFQLIKFLIRGVFTFIDYLRNVSFDETPESAPDRGAFLGRLSRAPRPEQILREFEEIYTPSEQNQVYRAIGESHPSKTSWMETIWDRSQSDNIALGRRLVRQNPFLLRDYLS